ncbi:DUF1676 domain-containing protein Osi19 [Lycorma delicatula]|uniref:DUF1676 domain-containing protein Osi19 n=1 Tax=Lycorma delicatula TaxID=130591 RepID=UPI003F51202B
MVRVQCFLAAILASSCIALPTVPEVTTATPELSNAVEDLRIQCSNNDGIACIKFKFLNLLDQALKKDTIQVTENVSVEKSTEVVTETPEESENMDNSASRGFLDQVDDYVRNHDIVYQLPQALGGARIALSPRNLDNNEVALKLKLQDESSSQVEGKGRKNRRLRRLLVPLIIFVLLKAMTIIPLAVGVLGLKAWNALQLSFFSFVISISLAIFQLCKKIAQDSAMPAAHTSGPWEAYNQYAAARNFLEQAAGVADVANEDPHVLAYNSHVPH